jgi:hypothetical protein
MQLYPRRGNWNFSSGATRSTPGVFAVLAAVNLEIFEVSPGLQLKNELTGWAAGL